MLWGLFDLKDKWLWSEFREAFEDFTEEDFKLVANRCRRELRAVLRKRGVWVEKGTRTPIATALVNSLKEKTRTSWTGEEIIRCHHEGEEFSSDEIMDFLGLPRLIKQIRGTPTINEEFLKKRWINQEILENFRKTRPSTSEISPVPASEIPPAPASEIP